MARRSPRLEPSPRNTRGTRRARAPPPAECGSCEACQASALEVGPLSSTAAATLASATATGGCGLVTCTHTSSAGNLRMIASADICARRSSKE